MCRARRSRDRRAVIPPVEIKRRREAQKSFGIGVDVNAPDTIAARHDIGEKDFVFEQEIATNKFRPRRPEIALAGRQEFLENFIGIVDGKLGLVLFAGLIKLSAEAVSVQVKRRRRILLPPCTEFLRPCPKESRHCQGK